MIGTMMAKYRDDGWDDGGDVKWDYLGEKMGNRWNWNGELGLIGQSPSHSFSSFTQNSSHLLILVLLLLPYQPPNAQCAPHRFPQFLSFTDHQSPIPHINTIPSPMGVNAPFAQNIMVLEDAHIL